MRVLLATSPHVRHAAVLQSDFTPDHSVMYTFAPVGLLSLAATLRRDRPDVSCGIYDINRQILSGALPLNAAFYAAVAEDICAASPDIIGFMTECDSYHHVLQIADAIKRTAPTCAVILGGPHASAVARQTLGSCASIDAVVIREGEATLAELLDVIGERSDRAVPGALRRIKKEGAKPRSLLGAAHDIVDGGPRALIEQLDTLPIPAYDLYRPDEGEEIFLEVGRGCPFACEFCSTAPYWSRRHRVKSPQRIVREIQLVRELYGAARVHFTHDLFTTNRDWVNAVCDALINAGVPARWTCSARTDTVDEALLRKMARAGCNAIYFGIESGSARILREIRKDIDLERSFEVLAACRRSGISANAGFIAGFPTEDAASLRETLSAYERALRLDCRPTHLFGYCPFAGSAMYPKLGELVCSGHFVDLPLGAETDLLNRRLVSSNQDLYGAYFRPRLPPLVPGQPDAIFALDEFSPLVETMLMPALALASALGGMYEVFGRWQAFIHAHNEQRCAPAHRSGYGSAVDFATFVLKELSLLPEALAPALDAARALHMNLCIAARERSSASTTMASHRSLPVPAVDASAELALGTRLSRGPLVGCLALEHDVTPVLLGRAEVELTREPSYLAWLRGADGSVRLLCINALIYYALEALDEQPATLGELILKQLSGKFPQGGSAAGHENPAAMLASLTSAAQHGLLSIAD